MREIIDKLEAELRPLEYELRVELPKEIGTAVGMGDLRENAEYKAALERQAYVKARIGQLRQRLATLNSISLAQVPRDKTGLGSTVKVLDLETDEELTYELVFPELADLTKGMLSIASPIGSSFVGRAVGDEITVKIPSGTRRFEIIELETIHEKNPDDTPG
jgi:transcription elongation factor GreA